MNGLIINCSAGMSVSVFKNNEFFDYVDNNEKRHSDELLIVVDNLLKTE